MSADNGGRPSVALLGTGIMGAGMGRSVLRAGLPLRVWNRTRAKAESLAGDGATVADSPADAVRDADVIVTMLPTADVAGEVINDAALDRAAKRGHADEDMAAAYFGNFDE